MRSLGLPARVPDPYWLFEALHRALAEENAIRGVAVREDFAGEACECHHRIGEPHEEGCPAEDESTPEGCAANDVFIVEGEQERYRDKSAWEVVRRY